MILGISKDSSQEMMSPLTRPEGPKSTKTCKKSSKRGTCVIISLLRGGGIKIFMNNIGVILIDLAEKWSGNSPDTVQLFFSAMGSNPAGRFAE